MGATVELTQARKVTAMTLLFGEIAHLAREGMDASQEEVVGILHKIAEVAVAGIPLHAALHDLAAPRISIEESGNRKRSSYVFGDSGVNVASNTAFSMSTESVGQDFMREILKFVQSLQASAPVTVPKPPRKRKKPSEAPTST